jgi:hypothetical protein
LIPDNSSSTQLNRNVLNEYLEWKTKRRGEKSKKEIHITILEYANVHNDL